MKQSAIATFEKVILKKGKAYSVRRFHPWIFSGAIQEMPDHLSDGCWVEVQQHGGKVLGYGHFQRGTIAVRMLSFGEESPQSDFWLKKIGLAFDVRRRANVFSDSTNACRLVHGEGDGLPGLIIDYYDRAAVVQAHSIGMHEDRHLISTALQNILPDFVTSVYYKSLSAIPGKMRDPAQDEYLFGMGGVPHTIVEHGNKFFVDWEEGQKTGFFLDQRENRKMLGDFCQGKRVLNTFCYTGGFSVYALRGNAEIVHSVDASEKAIELARRNIELNGFSSDTHTCYAEDTFDFLKDKKDEYDVLILDPPAFAKHRDARHQAVKGYQRLNAEAIRLIRSGGIIFTFSCSQVVDRQLFYDTIVSAGLQTGREIRVLHHLSQPADHPVSLYHPEGQYLKGLVLYVE